MSYILIYTRYAVKDIDKLDLVAKKKIKKKIEAYSKKPFLYGKKLINPAIGTYRWRMGNYRVVFDIDRENIVILRVGHRREIYK
ncbi:type II toxin-antitoxin system RelE/ParE family toxin [Candidatus Gottesmanbacteria bacterium]|nr:type II toxin-antitoxin system RelE/ParE family toxin [Candidatus Gottesmanbacteria bacterium]MBI5452170.1 type II toxin-antitoxin system RelE/ParE family toxin [Candidatus Gottesmanbacteria bacterium]